jgi:hypothetical protein
MQIERHNIEQFRFELGVGTKGKRADTMRLQPGAHQRLMHRGRRQAEIACQRADAPAAVRLRSSSV